MTSTFHGTVHGDPLPEVTQACNPQNAINQTARRVAKNADGSLRPVTGPPVSGVLDHGDVQPSYSMMTHEPMATAVQIARSIPGTYSANQFNIQNLSLLLQQPELNAWCNGMWLEFDILPVQSTGVVLPGPPVTGGPMDLTTNGPRPHNGIGHRLIRTIKAQNGGCGIDLVPAGQITNIGAGDMVAWDLWTRTPKDDSNTWGAHNRAGLYMDNMDPSLRGMLMQPRTLHVDLFDLIFARIPFKGSATAGMQLTFNIDPNGVMGYTIWEGAYAGLTAANALATYGVTQLPQLLNGPRLMMSFTSVYNQTVVPIQTDRLVPDMVYYVSKAAADTTSTTANLPSNSFVLGTINGVQWIAENGDPLTAFTQNFQPWLNRIAQNGVGAAYTPFIMTLTTNGLFRCQTAANYDDMNRLNRGQDINDPGRTRFALGFGPYCDVGDGTSTSAINSPAVIGVLQGGRGDVLFVQPASNGTVGSITAVTPPAAVYGFLNMKVMTYSIDATGWSVTPYLM